MTEPIKPGDELPCVGGPWDGEKKEAVAVFPWAPNVVNFAYMPDKSNGIYTLDREARCWRWCVEVKS